MNMISTLIPLYLRNKLIAAAQLPEDLDRRKAVDNITATIKAAHPELFRDEQK